MELIKGLGVLKASIKAKTSSITITNFIFKLHYTITFWIFMVSTILVCTQQYIGEHIRCLRGGKYLPEKPVDTFCFFTATFTVVKNLNQTAILNGNLPHPGVGPMNEEDDEIIRHAYYQWVPFVLFIQGLFFYAPYAIWKFHENGRMRALCSGFTLLDELDKIKKQARVDKVQTEFNKRLHVLRNWATWMIFSEFLNFLNIVFQIFITDAFLGGKFFSLGPRMLHWNHIDVNPLDEVFPKVTKCHFHKFGASGSIQVHDVLCVMALNIINEKIYLFLWWWLLFLFIVTFLGVLWRLLSFILHRKLMAFNKWTFRTACRSVLDPHDMEQVFKKTNYSDWIFLYYLAKNLHGRIFTALFHGLSRELDMAASSGTRSTNSSRKESVKSLLFEKPTNSNYLSEPDEIPLV